MDALSVNGMPNNKNAADLNHLEQENSNNLQALENATSSIFNRAASALQGAHKLVGRITGISSSLKSTGDTSISSEEEEDLFSCENSEDEVSESEDEFLSCEDEETSDCEDGASFGYTSGEGSLSFSSEGGSSLSFSSEEDSFSSEDSEARGVASREALPENEELAAYQEGWFNRLVSNTTRAASRVLQGGINIASGGVQVVSHVGRAIGNGIGHGTMQTVSTLAGGQLDRHIENLRTQDWQAEVRGDLAKIDPENQLDQIADLLTAKIKSLIDSSSGDTNASSSSGIFKRLFQGIGQYLYQDNQESISAFLDVYLPKMLKSILAHLALYEGVPAEDAEPKQLLLVNIVKKLLKTINAHMGAEAFTAIQEEIKVYKTLAEGPQKEEALQEIKNKILPFASQLLTDAGIASIQDLHLPIPLVPNMVLEHFVDYKGALVGLILNQLLKVEYQPVISPQEEETLASLRGYEHLASAAETGIDKGSKKLQAALDSNKQTLAEWIHRQLSSSGTLDVSAASIEELLSYLTSGDESTAILWQALEGGLKPRLLDMLKKAVNVDLSEAGNINGVFERLLFNSLKIIHQTTQGQSEALDAKVKVYTRFSVLIDALQSAERHFLKESAQINSALTSSQSPASQESVMNLHVNAAIAHLSPEQKAALVGAARSYFENSVTGDDAFVLRKLFFGEAQAGCVVNAASALVGIKENLTSAQERQHRALGGTFGGLEVAVLRLLGVETAEDFKKLKLPLPAFINFDYVKTNLLPCFLLGIYKDIKFPLDGSKAHIDLRDLLLNDPQRHRVLQDILQRGENINDHDRAFIAACGINDTVELMEGGLDVIAGDISTVVSKALKSEETLRSLLEPVLSQESGLDTETVASIVAGIQGTAASQDPAVAALFKFFQHAASSVLLKALVNIGKNVEANSSQHTNQQLIARALLEVFKRINHRKEEIAIALRLNHEPNTEGFKAVFRPIVSDIMALAGLDPLRDLPGPDAIKEPLWDMILNSVLPEFIGKMYVSTTAWENEEIRSNNEATFSRIYGTNHPKEAMNAIAGYSAESIQSFLALNSANVSSSLYQSLYNYLNREDTPHLVANLGRNRQAIEQLLSANIVTTVQRSETIVGTLDSAKKYLHSILSTAFANLSENVDSIDKQEDKHFLKDTAFKVLELFHSHVQKINRVRIDKKQKYAYAVDSADMVGAFADPVAFNAAVAAEKLPNLAKLPEYQAAKLKLKNAMAELKKAKSFFNLRLDKEAYLQEAKQKVETASQEFKTLRKEKYFVPLSKKILKLAKLDQGLFPAFPSPLKEQLWRLCEEELIPSILNELFLTLMRPQTLNSMMFNAITGLKETLEAPSQRGSPAALNAVPSPADAANDVRLGRLVRELLNLLPESSSRSIFNKEFVSNLTDPVIGAAIRNALEQKNIVGLIDNALFKGLPSLLPGTEWRIEDGQEVLGFIPKANEGGSGSSRHSYNLPLTEAESIAMQEERERLENAMPSDLKNLIVKTLSDQLKTLIRTTLDVPFQKMQLDKIRPALKEAAKKCFGEEFEKAMSNILDGINNGLKLFYDYTLGILFNIVFGVISKLFWLFVERVVLSARADELIKSVDMDIHEHLFFDLTNEIVESLETEVENLS